VDYARLDGLADIERFVTDEVPSEIAALTKEAEALKPAPDDAAKRRRRQQDLDEMEARKKLSADIETFVAHRNSLDLLIKIKACKTCLHAVQR